MDIQKKPSDVTAEHGEVMMDGPDGVAVSLTPDAAIETSERLLEKGTEARGQQLGEQALQQERRDLGLGG